MNDPIYGIPAYIILPTIIIVVATLLFVIVKAFNEGREITFWPPKIGSRPASKPDRDQKPNNMSDPSHRGQPSEVPDTTVSSVPSASLSAKPIGLLYVLSGSRPGLCYFVTEGHRSITVGRGSSCDIAMPDRLFSRMHFRIGITPIDSQEMGRRDYKFDILDSGSANGTFKNGKQIDHEELKNGDTIEVGGVSIQFFWIAG